MFKDFTLDKRSKQSPTEQLFFYFVSKVLSHQVVPNEALPSATELATIINTSIDSVERTYERLVSERYFRIENDQLVLSYNSFDEHLHIDSVLAIESLASFYKLSPSTKVFSPTSKPLFQDFEKWLAVPTYYERQDFHRLLIGNTLPLVYSVISMNQMYLPIDTSTWQLSDYMDHWQTKIDTSFTPLILLAMSLPDEIATHFNMPLKTTTSAIRSNLVNGDGVIMAVFLYIFSPRFVFHNETLLG